MQFLKNILKNIFNFFGVEIHKKNKYGKRTKLAEVLEHIAGLGLSPKTIIDVGVANGTFELYEMCPGAKHLLIEPLQEFEDALKRIALKYNAEFILAAAGREKGTAIINVHHLFLEGSSLLKESEGNYADGTPREIPVVTIDDSCNEMGLKGPYLIKVDAQGAELAVLDGAIRTLEDTEVIILEVQLFQFLVNGPQFYDIVNYMKDHGFVTYEIFGGYNRPIDNALASVEMVFVKEKAMFRKDCLFATREQREKLAKKPWDYK